MMPRFSPQNSTSLSTMALLSVTLITGPASAGEQSQRDVAYPAIHSSEVEIRWRADLQEALNKKFLRMYPEYETVEEACLGLDKTIHIGKTLYHDFDGDGFDEVAVLAYSCAAGTGGADLIGRFTRTDSGEVIELAINDAAFDTHHNRANLRGKANLAVEGERLIKEFPIYRNGDPNCCPSGGIRRLYYRWDGKAFLADKVEDQSPSANKRER